MKFHRKLWLGLVLGFACSACGDEQRQEDVEIEIEGTWASDFGTEVIDHHSWSVDYGMGATVSEVVSFSNDDNSAIVLSPDDAEFNPGTYGKNVWTDLDGDGFYYCTVAYAAESAEDAEQMSEPFDTASPADSGCGTLDFPWTRLTREE